MSQPPQSPQPAPQVVRLNHVNIRTRRLAETVRFYADILGLTEGDPPADLNPARIRWMFDGTGAAIVHISTPRPPAPGGTAPACDGPTGGLDHVAFALADHAEVLARLGRANVPYEERRVEAIGLTQLFVRDPNGIRLELNIRDPRSDG